MKKLLGIVVLGLLLSGNAYALTNDQKEMYEGCVEDATHLEQSRAKQYCKCITIMITDKYSIDEILRISQSSTEEYLKKFGFAVNYCNVNANAP